MYLIYCQKKQAIFQEIYTKKICNTVEFKKFAQSSSVHQKLQFIETNLHLLLQNWKY